MMRKVLNLKPGNAITRQYRNARKIRAFSVPNVILAGYLGYGHATQHNNIVFIDMVNIFIFGKLTEKTHAIMKYLKPEYKNIVSRAIAIYGKHKLM